ncbi:flagellar export chaperone FliS [Oceanidesulfovibrio marinus]|uniref:Flagellar export chaperone FliS n=1 Tax=Oceanidesulfovibrio marinus TaxID=370038 RepID=A0ABX6NFU6_9BACT|nr:flagellar export chaperone FliS [Oceanidesulfovibrio marinus]QJT09171.1 flagellar export chaperone FliS [Oceanidesulfovibrio marinus]
MQKAAQAYLQTQVSTTSQGELLLMLYDGAVKFLRQAQAKILEKDYAQKGILISKALDIIAELDGSLNAQKGGEIAQNLHNLYFYCNTRLLLANMNMDTALVDEVIDILSGLRSAYSEIIEKQGGAQPAPQAAPRQSGPRPPVLLNKDGADNDAAPASEQAQPQRGQSPLESLATHIARNPAPAKAPAAPSAPKQAPAKQAAPDAPAKSAAPDVNQDAAPAQVAEVNGQGAAAAPQQAQQPEEQPQPAAPSPNRGRLLAGASIYKKMASQSN